MITPSAYRKLYAIVPHHAFAIRVLCYLIAEYDMHRFVAVDADQLIADLGTDNEMAKGSLRELSRIGILETVDETRGRRGGRVRAKTGTGRRMLRMYRVNPVYWLDRLQTGRVVEECREIRERETLIIS